MSKSTLKKRDSSSSRDFSSKEHSPTKEVSSVASGVSGSFSGELWRTCLPVWPEWNETEVNSEKWDAGKGAKDGKARRSPNSPFFEDPEGKVKLPMCLNVHAWKRPSEHFLNKAPVVVENESTFNLTSANEHLLSSELMRRIISEICIVWQACNGQDGAVSEDPWRPWEHIYALCKAAKGHVPLYNVSGKYVVRLYWMGCWRKITIDDLLPFDEQSNLLLPATTNQAELWPVLLTKAILKLARTEVVRNISRELEEFSIIHCLTGWIPELRPLKPRLKYVEETWTYLNNTIPRFQQTEDERNPSVDFVAARDSPSESLSTDEGKRKGSGPLPASQIVMCASFQPLDLQEKKTSMLGQMADTEDTLRQYGLCQLYSHSVLLTCTRDCPLVDVSKPAPEAEFSITDEPRIERPEQYVRVSSPFIHFKLGFLKSDSKTPSKPLENEEPKLAHPDITHNPLDATNTEVPAEDERKDESVANDAAATDSSLVPEADITPIQGMHLQEKALLHETWVHIQNFTTCFQTLMVFHKPNSYLYQSQESHFKAHDEKSCYFLSVDNLQVTEILICFSALLDCGDTSHEQKDCVLRPGHLGVEPFSWKSVQAQEPLLNINTSSCKAALLTLPPGRHVLRIRSRAQLGIHVQVYSNTAFVFGDEEVVMPHLEKESLMFCEQARSILRALGGIIGSFSNPDELPSATRTLEELVCPAPLGKLATGELRKVFGRAVYHTFCCALGRKLTSEELFAIQTLTKDLTPHSSDTKDPSGVPDGPSDRQLATEQENQAATILQAGWKGYLVREILSAARPGSEENHEVAKILMELWACVESDLEQHAVSLLRYMIIENEQLVNLYPCGRDEWTKINFTDYSVLVHETSNSWVLLFREVFCVAKAGLLVPRICCPLRCHLHVINNDTGEEVLKFFNSVLPFTYTPNKAGYTFVAYTGEKAVTEGTWRLRLISSREQPAQLAREGAASNFVVKEFKEYYLPNKNNILCRYAVNVGRDHVVTVQFQTSNEDVYIKLCILDHDREVASKTGQGHVVIPVYCFSSGSRGGAVEKAGVTHSQDGPGGGASECPPAQMHHRYILQAQVLYSSWPLDDSLSGFILHLRETESNEMRVFRHLIEDTPANMAQPSSGAQKLSTSKVTKTKDKATFKSLDESKPHWTLRVVSEQSEAEQIEVKKDTERLEQIKAMKLAWEAAEPGRAAKAFQTRQQYLKHLQTLGDNYALDLIPFIRKTGRPERLKDAVMEEEQQRERLEKIQSFRLYRETVLERRRKEQEQTKQLIREQRELFDRIQEDKAGLLRKFVQTWEVIQMWKQEKKEEEESQKREGF